MNLNVDCWHCHSSTCQQSIAVATPDCDAAPRLSLQTPGLYIPHVLKLFSFFLNFLCRRLLLGSWEVSMNSISFSQVQDQSPLGIMSLLLFKTIWFNLLLISHFSLVGRTLMVLSTSAGSLYKSQFEVCGI